MFELWSTVQCVIVTGFLCELCFHWLGWNESNSVDAEWLFSGLKTAGFVQYVSFEQINRAVMHKVATRCQCHSEQQVCDSHHNNQEQTGGGESCVCMNNIMWLSAPRSWICGLLSLNHSWKTWLQSPENKSNPPVRAEPETPAVCDCKGQ